MLERLVSEMVERAEIVSPFFDGVERGFLLWRRRERKVGV